MEAEQLGSGGDPPSSTGVVAGIVVAQESVSRKIADRLQEAVVFVLAFAGGIATFNVAVEADQIRAGGMSKCLRASMNQAEIDLDDVRRRPHELIRAGDPAAIAE